MEEFIGDLGAWMLSDRVRTAFKDILGMVDGDVLKSGQNPECKGNTGCQPARGVVLGATTTGMAGRAAPDLGITRK